MSSLPAFSWKDAKILVADDEPDMREIFGAWFRNLGCFVREVPDGLAALEALAESRFDAVVTDVRMPRLDGIHLVRRLHHSGTYTPVVIFVSGFTDLELPDAFDLGVEAVLSKPCERKVLVNAVQRSLLRRDLVFSPPESVAPPAPETYLRDQSLNPSTERNIALGRGGMSLEVATPLQSDDAIGFSLAVHEGELTHLDGWGLLRWSESTPRGRRVGIEFLYLNESSRSQFARWLANTSPVSFIPKECRDHQASCP